MYLFSSLSRSWHAAKQQDLTRNDQALQKHYSQWEGADDNHDNSQNEKRYGALIIYWRDHLLDAEREGTCIEMS